MQTEFDGIERQKDLVRRAHLNHWFESVFLVRFTGRRILLSEAIAERTGHLMAIRDSIGIPISFTDAAIAATAIEHDLVLVTRIVKDFVRLPLDILDPWTDKVPRKA